MDPTENSLMLMKTWKFSFLFHLQITEDFSTLWDVLMGFFPRLNSFIIPFAAPLGGSQASHLLCDWRLRMGPPQILSPCWVFHLFPGLLPCVSWGSVLWDALGPRDAQLGLSSAVLAEAAGVTLLHPINLGGSGGGELTP